MNAGAADNHSSSGFRHFRAVGGLAARPEPLPLQGLHRVVLSERTALRMDGSGPPKLGVGTADARLPLSDAQGCNVMRAPSARLRTSVCTWPFMAASLQKAHTATAACDCDVVRESVRPVLVGGGRQQGAARHPWAAFRKQRESTQMLAHMRTTPPQPNPVRPLARSYLVRIPPPLRLGPFDFSCSPLPFAVVCCIYFCRTLLTR